MKPQQNSSNGYRVGQYLKLYKRIQDQLDQRAELGHNIRTNIGNKIVEVTPTWENENISPGTLTGAILTAVSKEVDKYVPVPILADTEIANVEHTSKGNVYTINVDAPLPQQARFEAMLEAGDGFTSLIIDQMDVSGGDVLRERPVRDTFEYTVTVKNNNNTKQNVGLGILDITKPPKEQK